jgi:hypothetical protein
LAVAPAELVVSLPKLLIDESAEGSKGTAQKRSNAGTNIVAWGDDESTVYVRIAYEREALPLESRLSKKYRDKRLHDTEEQRLRIGVVLSGPRGRSGEWGDRHDCSVGGFRSARIVIIDVAASKLHEMRSRALEGVIIGDAAVSVDDVDRRRGGRNSQVYGNVLFDLAFTLAAGFGIGITDRPSFVLVVAGFAGQLASRESPWESAGGHSRESQLVPAIGRLRGIGESKLGFLRIAGINSESEGYFISVVKNALFKRAIVGRVDAVGNASQAREGEVEG